MTAVLQGKVALVTGGSSGIGRAAALAFAREGASVVISADRNAAGGAETVRLVEQVGGSAFFVQADVSRASDVEAMVRRTVEAFGGLDCAFNNAGIAAWTPALETTEADWDRVIAVNLKGVWLCMKYEIPEMLRRGGGAIVNNSSVAGLVAPVGNAAYCASKHGVLGLTKAVALEHADQGIRVNAVCPGVIHTPAWGDAFTDPKSAQELRELQPRGRAGEPEEVAEAVVWLCSGAASLVTGVAFPVDGGLLATCVNPIHGWRSSSQPLPDALGR